MSILPYTLTDVDPTRLGLIVLQTDETIERDFIAMKGDCDLFFNRVPCGAETTAAALQAMAGHMATSASLFPQTCAFDVFGYGCTSGTAQIGIDRVRGLIQGAVQTRAVTQPVSALKAACDALGVKRLAFVSPYIEAVSAQLRDVVRTQGVEVPVFGTFDCVEERNVVRISGDAILDGARTLVQGAEVDAIFLSCTNLRALDVVDQMEAELNLPVLCSNQVLAWHMAQLSGNPRAMQGPGRLFQQ